MVNTGQTVVATVQTPGGRPRYDGDAAIDGVPGTAAPIRAQLLRHGRLDLRRAAADRHARWTS